MRLKEGSQKWSCYLLFFLSVFDCLQVKCSLCYAESCAEGPAFRSYILFHRDVAQLFMLGKERATDKIYNSRSIAQTLTHTHT